VKSCNLSSDNKGLDSCYKKSGYKGADILEVKICIKKFVGKENCLHRLFRYTIGVTIMCKLGQCGVMFIMFGYSSQQDNCS
jgi:hypothetical protein